MSWLSTSLDLSHINHFRTHNRKLVASYKKMKYLEPNLVGVKVVILPVYCIWNFWKGWIKIQKKNHTHMKRVGHTSEISFSIYYWKTRKIRILKKWKKIAGDNIISHICTKNHNHMRYCSWDTEWDKFALSFWAIFCPSPLPPPPILLTQKTKIFKKWKSHLEMHHLNLCNKKHD